ncbi:hypothetical protein [Nonomuraea rosea]
MPLPSICTSQLFADRLDQLKAEGYQLAEEHVAGLSPFVRQHINV